VDQEAAKKPKVGKDVPNLEEGESDNGTTETDDTTEEEDVI
jgi:hypothetical protein